MNTNAAGTWTKFNGIWMVRIAAGIVPAVAVETIDAYMSPEFHFDVVVVKRDGTEQTVSICRTPEFARDGIEIHALSKDGGQADRHMYEVNKSLRGSRAA